MQYRYWTTEDQELLKKRYHKLSHKELEKLFNRPFKTIKSFAKRIKLKRTLHARNVSTQERFERFTMPIPECGCWIWLGTCNKKGYGIFRHKATDKAHRASWLIYRGPIPENYHVLHRCDTPSCVNPHHLFLGTNLDNIHDSIKKGRHVNPCDLPQVWKYGRAFWKSKKYIKSEIRLPM